MQIVSSNWKVEQQKRIITAESLLEISLFVGDPAAQASAVTSDNGHEVYSNTAQLADETEKTPVRYATLEKNLWILNETFSTLPDTPPYGNNGFIGNELSVADGTFAKTPTIIITFSNVFDALIPGVTVTWGEAYGEWATSFRVTAYNGEDIVAQKTVVGNTDMKSVIAVDIQGYNKIVVEVLKWQRPYRRARIQSILIGVERIYTKADIMEFSHTMFVDPLSAELPKTEIKFQLKNLNGDYNPDNPVGAEKYLMQRQAVEARYGYRLNSEEEWIACGLFFMSEWETPQNGFAASFAARDLLEYMSDKYTGPGSGTLLSIATAALTQAGLPQKADGTNRWTLWSGLSDITAPSGADLSGYTIAETLQLAANAACCVFYQDRAGVLHIEPLVDTTSGYRIDRSVSYGNAEIALTKQLKAVNVNDGMAVANNDTVGEIQNVTNPLISVERADAVAQWAANYLKNRRVYTGNWRADPRLDVLDRAVVENLFASNSVLITEIEYNYNGAWRGSYEGRGGA